MRENKITRKIFTLLCVLIDSRAWHFEHPGMC